MIRAFRDENDLYSLEAGGETVADELDAADLSHELLTLVQDGDADLSDTVRIQDDDDILMLPLRGLLIPEDLRQSGYVIGARPVASRAALASFPILMAPTFSIDGWR